MYWYSREMTVIIQFRNYYHPVRTEVLTAVSMKSTIVWNVMLCSLVEFRQRFGWLCFRHILLPWRWKQYLPPKLRWNSTRLHGVTSHKELLFFTISFSFQKTKDQFLGFRVLKAINMKSTIFRMPCSSFTRLRGVTSQNIALLFSLWNIRNTQYNFLIVGTSIFLGTTYVKRDLVFYIICDICLHVSTVTHTHGLAFHS
jgi:hypothetical protein